MASNHRGTSLHWKLVQGANDQLELVLIPDPHILEDPDSVKAIEVIRAMTHERAHGWREIPNGPTPTLPWHPDLTPIEHSWMWMKLLKAYAIQPNLTAPKAIS
jgi:hypothetical protein